MGDLYVVTVDCKQPREPARPESTLSSTTRILTGAAAESKPLVIGWWPFGVGRAGVDCSNGLVSCKRPWFATMSFSRRQRGSPPLAVFETVGVLSLSFTVTSCRCDWVFSGHFHCRSRKIRDTHRRGRDRGRLRQLCDGCGFSRRLARRVKNRLDFEIGTTFGGAFSVGNPEFRHRAVQILLRMAQEGVRRCHAGYFSRLR